MRAFSDFERKIIQRMIELDEKPRSLNVLGNILNSFYGDSHLPDYCYISVESETNVSIQVKTDELNSHGVDWLQELDGNISKILLVTVILFEYLQESKLADFVGEIDSKSLGVVSTDDIDNNNYTTCDFLEDESKKLIYKYTRKKVYLTETLKVLANNNFKSEEEIRHEEVQNSTKKQLKFTQVALALTFFGLIASIFIPMFSTTEVKIKNDTVSTSITKSAETISNKLSNLQDSLNRVQISFNNKERTELSYINKQLLELNVKVVESHKNLMEHVNAHNKANALGRQKAVLVPHPTYWRR